MLKQLKKDEKNKEVMSEEDEESSAGSDSDPGCDELSGLEQDQLRQDMIHVIEEFKTFYN